MAETARSRAHRSLPEEITIWEILVRLPPKSLIRCRAVCRAWHRATSTRGFLLAHHAHQPTLPLLHDLNLRDGGHSLDTIPFHHHQGLQSVARFGDAYFRLFASCDGLLLLSMYSMLAGSHLALCNPATRQYARLPMLFGFVPLGMYPHSPTGKYRLLLYLSLPAAQAGSYVLTLGSGQSPRHIGCPDALILLHNFVSVLFRGGLHWHRPRRNMIMVFDTTAESFRQMRAPAVPGRANLFEMDGMLGMSIFNDATASIDIWMAHDYDSEVWAFKCRVHLPVAELTAQFGNIIKSCCVVFPSWDGGMLVLAKFGDWLLQLDVDGKLVASFHRRGLNPTQNRLKQSLVQHTFFPTLEGYVINASPFISPKDYVVNNA